MVGALGSPVLFEVRKAPGAPGVWEIQWVCTETPGLERWRDEDGGGGMRTDVVQPFQPPAPKSCKCALGAAWVQR